MSDIAHRLEAEIEAARAILSAYHDLLADDELKDSAIEGQTDLKEAIRRAVVRITELDAMIDGLNGLAEKIAKRTARLTAQRENLRTALAVAIEVTGKKRQECDIATVSLVPSQWKVLVTNEADIPAEFWKRGDPKLNKKNLLKALKAKRDIPGAVLSNSETFIKINPL